jgi:hypothetical protein
MCNEPVWNGLIEAMLNKKSFKPDKFSVSYILAGESTALGPTRIRGTIRARALVG